MLQNQYVVSVNVMNDDERHLAEYKKYANELLEKLKTETDKQHIYWIESRLKSVKRRIIAITNMIKNG